MQSPLLSPRLRLLVILAGVTVACEDGKGDRTEGIDENDPPAATDTGPDPVDWSTMPADDAGLEACFPGRDGTGTTCLPTVEWSVAWGADYDYPPPLDGDPHYAAPVRYLDLSARVADPDLYLAPNFQLGELLQERKGRFGLFQSHAVEQLQVLRDTTGGPLFINSAYRNVTYNAGVGGATWSRHQYGDAVDIRSNDASLDELAAVCADQGAGFVSVYSTHVHCDWRDDPLDPSFFDVADPAATARSQHASTWPTAEVFWTPAGHLSVRTTGFDEGTPRVRWTLRDAGGALLAITDGIDLQPPDAAVSATIDVGSVVHLQVQL